ncbi:SpoOM family protein [Paenibacillus alvei TS-15]|uniref:SpoOM family protein n=1 Tax=Paenibacillus alvei TS-15 TaxID=1117108 RepID=S9SSB2_PAEAL|nr:sporulation protein [Paenibacillus alvei]EPY07038.1 SpoOM family protein [Paenibacillus alvei TS-15]
MSFLKRVLAKVGIGSAEVDTVLHCDEFVPGQEATGVVYIQGGKTEQHIGQIYFFIKAQYVKESGDSTTTHHAVIDKLLLTDEFVLSPGERKEIPFQFILPERTPISRCKSPVWMETCLDIDNAIDPKDEDYLKVVTSWEMDVVLEALKLLGFRLRQVENEYAPALGDPLPFIQTFEFVPTSNYRSRLDEIEVAFIPRGDDLELVLQVDRKTRGLKGWFADGLDLDETYVNMTLSGEELDEGAHAVAEHLQEVISRYC